MQYGADPGIFCWTISNGYLSLTVKRKSIIERLSEHGDRFRVFNSQEAAIPLYRKPLRLRKEKLKRPRGLAELFAVKGSGRCRKHTARDLRKGHRSRGCPRRLRSSVEQKSCG